MARPTRTLRSKTRPSSAIAKKYKLPTQKNKESKEESTVLQPRSGNVDDKTSSLSPSSEEKTKTASKNKIGRPPMPGKKAAKKKTVKKKEGKYEAKEKKGMSPLRKLLSRENSPTVAPGSRTPIRPRRRAATNGKNQYADVHNDTDDESCSSDESKEGDDYRVKNEKNIKTQGKSCSRKVKKRKAGIPAARKTNVKKQKVKTPSPLPKSKRNVPSASKKAKNSPSVFSTPKGAIIGLTPIKDSISKVWDNNGGDWRVQGAIDYDF